MTTVKQFSAKGAKVLAAAVARFAVGWGVAWLAAHGVLSATWAADPQHLMTVALIVAGLVYEAEEVVWRRWGFDIPGTLARIGVPLMEGTPQAVVAPADAPANPPEPPKVTP